MAKVKDTHFANQIHQLLVSVSRHFYVTKDGVVKYQKKPMAVNIADFPSSRREHIVYYILRDLFSGNLIFQTVTTKTMLPLLSFLHGAWKKNEEEPHFWGLPQGLSVPKQISSPELLQGLSRLGIDHFHPSSGFTSGIRVIRDLENSFYGFVLKKSSIYSMATLEEHKKEVYRLMLQGMGKIDKIAMWGDNLLPDHPLNVQDYSTFVGLFPQGCENKAGLKLTTGVFGGEKKARQLGFLNSPVETNQFFREKLDQASELIYEAYETEDRDKMLYKAYQALNLSPYCADAYVLLAEESNYSDERLMLFQRAMTAAKLSLGELFFKRNRGHFWAILKTRSYMRALFGMADCLWEKGQRGEALDIYKEMLELDSNDNLGVRHTLSYCLVNEKRHEELEELFKVYEEESCYLLYNLALSRFLSGNAKATPTLSRALSANSHVPGYLLGETQMPYPQPDYYGFGSQEEAIIYASRASALWRNALGALDWLSENRSLRQKEEPFAVADPSLDQVLHEFLDEQALRLSNKTFDKYESIVEWLKICLNNYGHTLLTEDERKALAKYSDSKDCENELAFCHLFGPKIIPAIMPEFLGHFMTHKIICGKDELKSTGTVMKTLARWLGSSSYINEDLASEMALFVAERWEDSLAAYELMGALFDFVENSPPSKGEEERDDLFYVVKVEPGKLYLQAGSEKPIVLAVPKKISGLCKEGWMINLWLVRTKRGWRICEVGGVHVL